MDTFPWDCDVNSPQQDALRAIAVFLEGLDFRVRWGGTEEIVVGRELECLSKRWWRLGFVGEELFLRHVNYPPPVDKQVAVDCGGCYFELADPACFDQIVVALVERLDE